MANNIQEPLILYLVTDMCERISAKRKFEAKEIANHLEADPRSELLEPKTSSSLLRSLNHGF
jgi:hypothetical protein